MERKKQVLRNYDVGNTQTEDSVVFEVPEEWLNKEVKLYLENKEGINQQQKLACLFLSQDQGCKCRQSYLFGTHPIPAFNQYLLLKVNQSKWKITVA